MIHVTHYFIENDVIFLSRFIINLHDAESEAASQSDNGRIVIVWERTARD